MSGLSCAGRKRSNRHQVSGQSPVCYPGVLDMHYQRMGLSLLLQELLKFCHCTPTSVEWLANGMPGKGHRGKRQGKTRRTDVRCCRRGHIELLSDWQDELGYENWKLLPADVRSIVQPCLTSQWVIEVSSTAHDDCSSGCAGTTRTTP